MSTSGPTSGSTPTDETVDAVAVPDPSSALGSASAADPTAADPTFAYPAPVVRTSGAVTIDAGDKTFVRFPAAPPPAVVVPGAAAVRGTAADVPRTPPVPRPPRRRFGDYDLVREIARGGMGVVYEAVQTRLKRTVAVKMILAGQVASEQQVQRFVAEARSVAALDHPNIVPVYEVGQEQGLHFFSMKLVDGGSLSGRLAEFAGDCRRAAELVEKVARAVHHAHQRGVLHRDLKPGNILLDAAGEPLVTDFGLAKLVDDDEAVTRSDAVVGTPAYMAPEQARGGRDATTAVDTWALGVILYQLLARGQPFRGATSHETLKLVTDAEPVPPRQRNPRVPRDLETVCLKCLRKEPGKRYATADGLAADLRRFLNGEPVEARPVGRAGRLWRWCRRNPGLAATGAAAVLATAAAVVILSAALVVAGDRAAKATALAGAAARLLDSERLRGQQQAWDNVNLRLEQALGTCGRDPAAGLLMLAGVLDRAEQAAADDLAAAARLQLAGWGRAVHRLRCTVRHAAVAGRVTHVALAPDGSVAFTGGDDNRVRAFDAATGRPVGGPLRLDAAVGAMAVDPATGLLLVGLGDGTCRWWDPAADDGSPAGNLPADDAAAGRPALPPPPRHENGSGVAAIAFAPLGRRVLTAGQDGVARLWDARTGERVGPEMRHGTTGLSAVALSEHGNLAATGSADRTVRVWRLGTGEPVGEPLPQVGPVWGLAFREPYGQLVVLTSAGATVYNPRTGEAAEPFRDVPDGAFGAALSPDGGLALVADGGGGLARLIPLSGRPAADAGAAAAAGGTVLRHRDNVNAQAFSGDGRTIVTGSADGLARVWAARGEADAPPDAAAGATGDVPGAQAACLSPDGSRVAVGKGDGSAVVLDAATRRAVAEFRHDELVAAVAFSPDGRRLLTGGNDNVARLWDLATRRPVGDPIPHDGWVLGVAFSPDGKLLLTAGRDGQVHVRRAADLSPARPPVTHEQLRAAVFSPDGTRLATAGADGVVRVWPAAAAGAGPGGAGAEPVELHHDAGVWAIAFSPDGTRLVSAGEDKAARIWDLRSRRQVGRPMPHTHEVLLAAFAPDGRVVATAGRCRTLRLWDAATGDPRGPPAVLPDFATALAFAGGGHVLVVGANDGSAVVWDVGGHRAVGPPIRSRGTVTAVGFGPAGDAALVASLGGDVRLHPVVPVAGTPAEVARWARDLTGLELDAAGSVRVPDPGPIAP